MKKKIRVAVLMGGKSSEHEISLISGKEVVRNLDKKKYSAVPVVIPRSGSFKLPGKIDIVFIALHGSFGEDGKVQGMLELAGIPYTGSGVLASAVCLDKLLFRKLMEAEGILTPKYLALRKNDKNLINLLKEVGRPPYFVKPSNQGSSIGTSLVKKYSQLSKALNSAFKYSDTVLVDKCIEGREVTVSILGNEDPKALPIIEIKPHKGNFFNYKSKYEPQGATEEVPARLPAQLTRKIQDIALRVYKLVDARGFGRVDFIIGKKNKPYILEINTIPGLTPMSLFPKAAKAAGLTYPRLLDRIIQYATQILD